MEGKLKGVEIPKGAKPDQLSKIQHYKMQLIKQIDQFKRYLTDGSE